MLPVLVLLLVATLVVVVLSSGALDDPGAALPALAVAGVMLSVGRIDGHRG